jgi:hypothetical protein
MYAVLYLLVFGTARIEERGLFSRSPGRENGARHHEQGVGSKTEQHSHRGEPPIALQDEADPRQKKHDRGRKEDAEPYPFDFVCKETSGRRVVRTPHPRGKDLGGERAAHPSDCAEGCVRTTAARMSSSTCPRNVWVQLCNLVQGLRLSWWGGGLEPRGRCRRLYHYARRLGKLFGLKFFVRRSDKPRRDKGETEETRSQT